MSLIYPFTSVLDIMKPCKVDPKKPTQVKMLESALTDSNYIWEEKLDGISILSIGGRLFSNVISKKTGYPSEKTLHLPQVSKAVELLGTKLILDGEAYYPGFKSNNVTSITNSSVDEALRKQSEGVYLQYWVYDILRDIDGTWLINKPFIERRKRLEEIFVEYFSDIPGSALVLNEVHDMADPDEERAQVAFERIIAAGGEGLVLKDKYGTYQPGKRPMGVQIKVKASLEDDVVIMGFNPPIKIYTGKNLESWPYWEEGVPVTENYHKGLIGSIMIGKYDSQNNLIQVGNVTGIKDSVRVDMTMNPEKYIDQVIVIKAMEKTEDGMYRHANYKGLHGDKNPFECKLED